MILEGLVTSRNAAGDINLAPMGPIVDESMTTLILRPFQTSTTYQNLRQNPQGVFHVVDDVLLIAQAALHRLAAIPETFPAARIEGRVLQDCCRWYEFEIVTCDDSNERTRLEANVVHTGRIRDMFGFHRARHAVLEATILATRLHLLAEQDVRNQLNSLAIPVDKTAGPREREAFALVCDVVDTWYRSHPAGA
ncbi:MAG: DUF447 family protein [Planctomycetes bacterium]|nr:DUF447 family protein [Planctomycetota bacterium]